MNELRQIFETVNIGLVILDNELKVRSWNRWMALQSGVTEETVVGSPILSLCPHLNNPVFLRNCKAVRAFGNFAFFSQKLHGYLFPFPPPRSLSARFEFMQQSCTMGPIRNDEGVIESIFLIVQDVTELTVYEKKLVEMNMKDGLTGIFNRRYLDRRLEEEFQRARRYGREFSLIVCDIDFFKKVNDTYGHQCGDLILKNVSAKIASALRKTDCLGRYGGEEFCCILPETGLEQALLVAERVREMIQAMESLYEEQTVMVSISLGVSRLDERLTSEKELFSRADEALYEAKRTGRNRVMTLDPPAVQIKAVSNL
jgi:diguanylate cyclase (GGDEF)-like protein